MEIKCIVGCIDAGGDPDFQLVVIENLTKEDYDDGIHYDYAKDLVEVNGFEPRFVCDEHDAGFETIRGHDLDWSTALTR